MDESWDYSKVARRSWQWPYESESDRGVIHLDVSPEGLTWRGDTFDSRWAGGYAIGLQSFESFLADGAHPLAYAPTAELEAIRNYIASERVAGPRTTMTCSVLLEPWRLRKLRMLSVYLNKQVVFRVENRSDEISAQHTFEAFVGTVRPGEQTLLVSWSIYTAHTGEDDERIGDNLRVRIEHGQEARVVIRITDAMKESVELNPRAAQSAPRRATTPASFDRTATLRAILAAFDEWEGAGDAYDHGAVEQSESMRQHAILTLEEAFLAPGSDLQTALPTLWALIEVGGAHVVFERTASGHDYRAVVEQLLAN